MSPDGLMAACRNTGINGIYLMPTCSNPTSIFMPQPRRMELAEIIRQFHLLVIEDDIYSFLSAYGHTSPAAEPFFSLLPEQTVHICSISKSLCAGLRVAFLAFPDRYRELLVSGMLGINLKTVSLNSEIIAELIENGEAENIVRQKILSARKRNQIFKTIFSSSETDNIERFFHWLPLPPICQVRNWSCWHCRKEFMYLAPTASQCRMKTDHPMSGYLLLHPIRKMI